MNLLLENKPLDFDKVQFQGNFKQYPKIKYGLRVKDGKSDIIADIQNDSSTTAVVAEGIIAHGASLSDRAMRHSHTRSPSDPRTKP